MSRCVRDHNTGVIHVSCYAQSDSGEFEKGLCYTVMDEHEWTENVGPTTCFVCLGLDVECDEQPNAPHFKAIHRSLHYQTGMRALELLEKQKP